MNPERKYTLDCYRHTTNLTIVNYTKINTNSDSRTINKDIQGRERTRGKNLINKNVKIKQRKQPNNPYVYEDKITTNISNMICKT